MAEPRFVSTLYNGGGTANALITTKTTSAVAAAEVLTVGEWDTLHLMLTNPTAGSSLKVIVTAYSAATPTIATQIFEREIVVGTTDLSATVDRAMVGLTTGTEHYTKAPISVSVPRGSYVVVASNTSSGGTWYARYWFSKGGASAEVSALDDVETKLDTINTSLGTVNTSVGTVNTTLGTALPRKAMSSGTSAGADQTMSWAASAAQDTADFVDYTSPATQRDKYIVSIKNPSAITVLNARVYNKLATFGGATINSLLTSFNVAASTLLAVEDCEDAWNELATPAEITSDVDAADYKVGSKAVKITASAAFTTGIVATEVISKNLTNYDHLRLWIKSDVLTASGDIQILLDNTAECASPLETLNVPGLTANTWTLVYLPLSDPSLLSAVISIGLKINVDKGAQNIWVDDVQGLAMSAAETVVEGMFSGATAARVWAKNATVLDVLDAFDATVRVREA